jgi:hypothetical protein
MGKRDARLRVSRAVVSLADLNEASAYRITPTRIFAFRKAKTGKGIVMVNYLHKNVAQHWDDLADPPADSALANLVIGTIPKHYKKPQDLQLKDKTKTHAELMSSDDAEEEKPKAKTKAKAAPEPEEEEDTDIPPEVDALAVMDGLLYNKGTDKHTALALLYLTGNEADSAESLLANMPEGTTIETAISIVQGVSDALSAKGYAKVTSSGIEFDPTVVQKAKLAVSIVGSTAKPPAPTPAPNPFPFDWLDDYVPPAPVPSPAPAPIPTPVEAAPKKKLDLSSLAAPPSGLTLVGDAQGALGGYHAKYFLEGPNGQKFLFKPKDKNGVNSVAGMVYSNLASLVLGKENVVPVSLYKQGAQEGSVQPMVSNYTVLSDYDLTKLTPSQYDDLMRERVTDWALSSHDTKAGNFLILEDGRLIGIDKEQAFRFIGKDRLDTDYKPNNSPQVYSQLFDLWRKKQIDLTPHLAAMGEALDNLDNVAHETWVANIQHYIDALGDAGQPTEQVSAEIMARKGNARTDLEKFITGIMRDRGDIGPKDSFTFESLKKKKKPVASVGSVAPMGSLLATPAVADFNSLLPTGKKVSGATGQTFFYKDGNGKQYVVKLAVNRMNSSKQEPQRAAAQEIFSQLSAVVRPGKSLPVATIPGGVNGVPATIQPWIEGSKELGKSTPPSSLSSSELKDIAEEHVLDWLLSQHDTHGGNLLKRPDGSIISIDKEQGFKFFMGPVQGVPADTKLSTTYHPNKQEDEAYYNKMWRAFEGGGLSQFNPKEMNDVISRIEGISDSDYLKLMEKYAEVAPFKDDPKKVTQFLNKALERKQNIRKDFEEFVTGLYRKRDNVTTGNFTFKNGWKAKGGKSVAVPSLNPKATGALGLKGVDLFVPAAYVPPPTPKPPPPPPVPAGFAVPPAGKMWEVKPVSQFFSATNHLYKVKAPKDANGNVDTSSANVLVKLQGLSVAEATDAFVQAGTTVISLKEKDGKVIALLSKDEWDKTTASSKQIGVLKDLPPPPVAPPPPSSKAVPTPKPGQLQTPVATATVEQLATIDKDFIGAATPLVGDGSAVEHQTMFVQRRKDASGKTYYRMSFKLREKVWTKLAGASNAPQVPFKYNRSKYEEASDSWQDGSDTNNGTDTHTAAQWTVGNNKMWVCNGADGRRSMSGRTFIDVYPEAGKTVEDSVRECLNKAQAGFADTILRTPTDDERANMNMAALLWGVSPKEFDSIPESQRTNENLRKRLNAQGYSDEDIASIRQERTAFGVNVPVLPGRHKRVLANNPNLAYITHAISSPDKLVNQLRLGCIGIGSRQDIGIGTAGAQSSSSDYAPDMNSGGADYLFCAPVKKGTYGTNAFHWGDVEVVFDPSVLDRLDVYVPHGTDPYGKTTGPYYDDRKSTDSSQVTTAAEIDFRMGIGPEKIMKIRVKNASKRADVLTGLKQNGITTFNGQSIEDLVVVADTSVDFYDTYLKPAGY